MQTPDDSRPAYYPPSTSDHFSGSDEHDRDHSPAGPSGSLSGSEEAVGFLPKLASKWGPGHSVR